MTNKPNNMEQDWQKARILKSSIEFFKEVKREVIKIQNDNRPVDFGSVFITKIDIIISYIQNPELKINDIGDFIDYVMRGLERLRDECKIIWPVAVNINLLAAVPILKFKLSVIEKHK